MRRGLGGIVVCAGLVWQQASVVSAQARPASVEVAFVANAEAGTVALVDIARRTLLGTIDVNPAGARGDGPGRRNYAQDTDISPDGRTLYVSRGYLGDVAAFDIASAGCRGSGRWTRGVPTI